VKGRAAGREVEFRLWQDHHSRLNIKKEIRKKEERGRKRGEKKKSLRSVIVPVIYQCQRRAGKGGEKTGKSATSKLLIKTGSQGQAGRVKKERTGNVMPGKRE